jgi:hypothetical protein
LPGRESREAPIARCRASCEEDTVHPDEKS